MPTQLQIFDEIISAGNHDGLRAFFAGSDQQERSAFAAKAIAWYRKARNGKVVQREPNIWAWERDYPNDVEVASATAVLVTAAPEQLAKIDWSLSSESFDFDFVLKMRPPALQHFGEVLVRGGLHFELVRRMMECGLCCKPASENYIIGLMAIGRRLHKTQEKHSLLKLWLLDNPDLLEVDVWRLFEVEGDKEISLRQVDAYTAPQNSWAETLYQLSQENVLSRERLLKASLEALGRGFNQYKSLWFSQFHEYMQPTVEERLHLETDYALLLGSTSPSTVTFALKALKVIEGNNGLSANVLSKSLPQVMSVKSKSTITAAISFLENAVKRDSSFSEEAALICIDALQHESPELQKQVLKFLERNANRECSKFRNKIALYADGLSPLVVAQFEALTQRKTDTKSQATTQGSEQYSFQPNSSESWPLGYVNPVVPILDGDEFIETALYCLEHPYDAFQLERIFQAVSTLRLREEVEFEKQCAPIISRAKKLRQSTEWHKQPSALIADFLYQWLTLNILDNVELVVPDAHAVVLLMRRRLTKILERTKQSRYLPLLSSPCFVGGWIDSRTFESRLEIWNAAGETPDAYEQMLALFRMPNSERRPNYEFGSIGNQLKAGLEKWEDIRRGPDLYDRRQPMTVSYYRDLHELETAVNIGDGCIFSHMTNYTVACWATNLFPSMRESILGLGVNWGVLLLDEVSSSDRGIRAFFEMLAEPGAPLGRQAYVMMLIGLLMKDPEFAGFSRDAVIQAIDERRLDPEQMGKRVAQFLHSDRAKPKRLASSMREIARVSSVHSDAMLRLICCSFHGDSKNLHKDASAILELLLELLTASGSRIENEDIQNYLSNLKIGGKTAKLVKSLLAFF